MLGCFQLFMKKLIHNMLKKRLTLSDGRAVNYWLLPLMLRTDGGGAFHLGLRNRVRASAQVKTAARLGKGRSASTAATKKGEEYVTAVPLPTASLVNRKRKLEETTIGPSSKVRSRARCKRGTPALGWGSLTAGAHAWALCCAGGEEGD